MARLFFPDLSESESAHSISNAMNLLESRAALQAMGRCYTAREQIEVPPADVVLMDGTITPNDRDSNHYTQGNSYGKIVRDLIEAWPLRVMNSLPDQTVLTRILTAGRTKSDPWTRTCMVLRPFHATTDFADRYMRADGKRPADMLIERGMRVMEQVEAGQETSSGDFWRDFSPDRDPFLKLINGALYGGFFLGAVPRLDRKEALTLEQARKKAAAYLGKVATNTDPQDEIDQLRTAHTGKQLVEAYMENHAKPKKRSWKNDKSCLERLFLPRFGVRLAITITSAEIQEIHAQKGTIHPRQANRFVEIVRKMFNWAPTAGLLPKEHDNPGIGIVPFPTRKRKRFITTVEMPHFVEALEQEGSEYGRHGIWLLLFTGLRTTELLKAKCADIDWNMERCSSA